MTQDNTIISVRDLTKIYYIYAKPKDRLKEAFSLTRKKYHTDFYALRDINFDVKEGECFGIIGKNGSGKSTLLKIITGVLTQTKGDVNINGRISALLELGAGFNQEYTGIENVYLNGDIMGFTKEEMDAKLDEIIEFADIGDHINQPVKTYSSGMFVRLAFALAINVDPEILIVDEALSVGDAFFQLKCYKKFMDFKRRGKTIIFVTHDLSSVIKYCDRVMVLNEGDQIEIGEARDMVDLYKKILVNQENKGKDKESGKELLDSGLIKSNVPLSENIIDYGTKQAEFTEINLYNRKGEAADQIAKFDELTIAFKVRFNEEIHNPIFAVSYKDIKGTELTGTNNMFEGMDGFIAKAGETYEVSFKQIIPFQSGNYFISLGCTGIDADGTFIVYHRFYDIIDLKVISEKDTVGFFDTNTEISINKLS
ncbi:MAG: ABC transporter ATP-binding protein [Eubacteriaceae bacterium]|nr:ABC transporter ATP-binding protein [Eubacteriaceae bacterium]MBR0383812.1 ABC transporter ATP-binding protein [Eubacteriaceae bacterium]